MLSAASSDCARFGDNSATLIQAEGTLSSFDLSISARPHIVAREMQEIHHQSQRPLMTNLTSPSKQTTVIATCRECSKPVTASPGRSRAIATTAVKRNRRGDRMPLSEMSLSRASNSAKTPTAAVDATLIASGSSAPRPSQLSPARRNGKRMDELGAAGLERFSPRQVEVLQRLWQGKQNKRIAYDLEISESTVKVHVRHIMKKLNARNRTQVVLRTRSLCQVAVGLGV
jgi:DNA-binding NarL/FixJ family response regulator